MSSDSFYFGRHNQAPEKRIWLTSTYRVELIKVGIEKAGSINRLAREIGYRSRIHPGWSIRQILVGEQPFPYEKLVKLSDYVGYALDDVLTNKTEPERVTVYNTNEALRQYGLWCYHIQRLRMR